MKIEELLESLGLADMSVGPEVELPPMPSARVAEGAQGAAAIALVLPELGAIGLDVDEYPRPRRRLRLVSRDDGPLRVFPGAAPGVTRAGRAIEIELAVMRDVVVMRADDTGVVVRAATTPEHRPRLAPLFRAALELPPPLAVRSDLLAWIPGLDDPWLEAELTARLASGSDWQHAVAIGMLSRLWQPRGAVAHELFRRPRRWIEAQAPAQCEALTRRAMAVVDRLADVFERLVEDVRPDDLEWQEEMLQVWHARDDVEGVRLLLSAVGHAERLEAALEPVDGEAGHWMCALPWWDDAWDERIGRAGVADPDVWWTTALGWSADGEDDA